MYNDLTPDPRVLDITVEDPSDEFCALRDFVDCRNALKMACFRPPAVYEGFGAEMEKECKERLKLHKVWRGGELWMEVGGGGGKGRGIDGWRKGGRRRKKG